MDGEGTILWNVGTVVLRATNTHEPLIDWLVERCGGSKHREIVSEDRRDTSLWRPKWRWTVTNIRAVVVLEAIRPHMIVKGALAEDLVERWYETLPDRRAGSIAKQLGSMDRVGWPTPLRLLGFRPTLLVRS